MQSPLPNVNLTQSDLKKYGLSDYLVKEIVATLKPVGTLLRAKTYSQGDIEAAIAAKLSKPRTKPKTRKILQGVLLSIQGKNNVIQVDFLKKLSPQEQLEFLNQKMSDLFDEEKAHNQESQELLKKAAKYVG